MQRRHFLSTSLAATLGMYTSQSSYSETKIPTKILFVHGIGQQGKDPIDLKETWIRALKEGLANAGLTMPEEIHIRMPFYGDTLANFVKTLKIPLSNDIQARGDDSVDDEFLYFQAEIAEEIRKTIGITDEQIDIEYGSNPRARGPQNWEWVQAIVKALDKHAEGLTQITFEKFLRDVYLYTNYDRVQKAIDAIVSMELTDEPTIVVGHSLGSVVSYNVLRKSKNNLNIPLFITVGSPLGIRYIRQTLQPIERPKSVSNWINAYDKRDIVALHPLDKKYFPVSPAITNFDAVQNQSTNRHGIDGYLNDVYVSRSIHSSF